MTDRHKPIETPRGQRVVDFRQRTLPLLVWSVCALLVTTIFFTRAQRFDYIGLAQAVQFEISSEATGTLDLLVVDLFDDVERGDLVARLDDSFVVAQLDTAGASITQFEAELEKARVELIGNEAGLTADLRRFQVDEETRRLEILRLKVVIGNDQVELERLDLELQKSKVLLETEIISKLDHDRLYLEREQVRGRIEENQVLLAQAEAEYQAARERREAYAEQYQVWPVEQPLLQPLQAAIDVEAARLGELEVTRRSLALRSPVSGQVSQILCRQGQSVVPGEPILTVAERSVQQIVAYLNEFDSPDVAVNTPVRVSSRARAGITAESVVIRISPTVDMLPQRLWRDPRVADYGRAVVIAAVPSMRLTPGEVVDVKFMK
jgi:multidrug resistance efflux pump